MSTTLAADVSKEILAIDLAVRAALMSGEIGNAMQELHKRIVSY